MPPPVYVYAVSEEPMAPLPYTRLRIENELPLRPGGKLVLYWMTAARRTSHNFALDHAIDHARRLGKPLVVLEALRCDYQYASDRLHLFVLQGMADNLESLKSRPVTYLPYVESRRGEGKGLLSALSGSACVVVTDRFPAFFLPHMLSAAAARIDARLESVDSCGLLPLSAAPKAFARAHDFRRFLSRRLPEHLKERPRVRPFQGVDLPRLRRLPRETEERWPMASLELLSGSSLFKLPIDHSVGPGPLRGGQAAGRRMLGRFVSDGLDRYQAGQRHPDDDATSGISPYLHFGQLGAHQVIRELERASGKEVVSGPDGWPKLGESVAAYLDQLVTWRELGYVHCALRDDASKYRGLPPWCRQTLRQHQEDPRPALYDLDTLMRAGTSDEIWNAAQRQLLRQGRIHNYLRMIWGKRVIEWSATPEEAFERLVHMNDRLALDGRDPNSYSGIGWCFGRYDRPWPTRPIFGQVRYMSSEMTRRKLHMKRYLEEFGPSPE